MRLTPFVLAAAGVAALDGLSAPVLTGEMSNARTSWYRLGEKASVVLHLTGLEPGEKRNLWVNVTDDNGKKLVSISKQARADVRGNWSGVYDVPCDRLGFYAVRPYVEGGLTLPKVGSRPAGMLCYSVTPDFRTKPVPDEEDAFFGAHGVAQEMVEYLGMHVMHGWGSAREDEKSWNEGRRERTVAAAKHWPQYGFCANLIQFQQRTDLQTPECKAYLEANKGKKTWDLIMTAEGERHYRDVVAKTVRRVKERASVFGNRRRIFEVFWEPDLSKPSDETLVAIARMTYEAAHAADPDCIIAVPTYAGVSTLPLHRRLFELGLAKYMDAFAIHPYCFPPELNKLKEKCRAYREMIREFKGHDVPMIGTESGYSAKNSLKEEQERRDGTVRHELILLGEGFAFNTAFYGYDFASDDGKAQDGDYGINYNLLLPHQHWGPNYTAPKPVFPALAAAVWFLDGKRPTAALDTLGETAQGYAYADRADNCVIAVWDWGGNTPTVSLPVGRDEIEVADIMGNVSTVKCGDGRVSLTLSSSPQYVLAPSAKLWGRNGTAAKQLAKEAAERQAAEEARRPVAVGEVRAASSGRETGVQALVSNRSDKRIAATVATRIKGVPEARREAKVSLGPKETRRVFVAFDGFRPDPFRTFEVGVTATPDAGEASETKETLNFLIAPRVPADASLANWPSLSAAAAVPNAAIRAGEFHHGEKDCSATLATGWNEKGLLFEVVAKDDEFVQKWKGWWTWRGDALQFGLAKNARLKAGANAMADQMDTAYSEISFAHTENGPEVYRTVTFDPKNLPADLKGAGQVPLAECPLATSVEKTADGVTIRYRLIVPWAFLNKSSAEANENVWFALAVNDCDADGLSAIGAFELKTSAPSRFGSVTLAP